MVRQGAAFKARARPALQIGSLSESGAPGSPARSARPTSGSTTLVFAAAGTATRRRPPAPAWS